MKSQSRGVGSTATWIVVSAVSLALGACTASSTAGGDGGVTDATPPSGDGSDAAMAMISMSPQGHDFGMVIQGTTRGPVSFTVTNLGGSSSGAMTASLMGPNATEFNIVSNGCVAPLDEAGTCIIVVSFSPTSGGPKAAGLQVASVSGGTVASGLLGSGVAPSSLSITPNTQGFGTVAMGASSPNVNFTVTNTGGVASGVPTLSLAGGAPSEFSIQTNGCVAALVPGGNCVVAVRFNPTTAGAKSAVLRASATPGGTAMAALTGDAVDASAGLVISPSLNDFGSLLVGAQSPSIKFTVTNNGALSSGVPSVSLGGVQPGQFQITNNGCSVPLATTTSCTVEVRFSPTAPGNVSALLNVAAMPGGTVTAGLSGQGSAVAALAISPSLANLGSIVVGSTGDVVPFTVSNSGDVPSGPLSTSLVGPEAGSFSITSNGCLGKAIEPGAVCVVGVRFSPTLVGARAAILTVVGLPGGTVAAALSGRGLAPGALSISPASRQYGGVVVGATTPGVVYTVTNTGAAPTGILQSLVVGPHAAQFSILAGTDSCSNKSLSPSATCSVSVAFAPSSAGDKSASLSVSGTPGGTVFAALSGTGIRPAQLSVAPAAQDFGTVVVDGASDNANFIVTNVGGETSGGITASLTGVDAAAFTVVINGCTTLLAGDKCTVIVRFVPKALGRVSAGLEVGASPGGLAVAALGGEGIKPAALSISPTPFSFGELIVGQSSVPVVFTVKNTGGDKSGALAVALSGANAGEFTLVANNCTTLAAGGICTVLVKFGPTSGGAKAAEVTVKDGTVSSVSAALSGSGLGKLSIEPTPYDFGEISLLNLDGSLLVKQFTVRCAGGGAACGPLTTGITTAAPSSFAITGLDTCATSTLASGGSCAMIVRFLPSSSGDKAGTLDVVGGAGEAVHAVLTGKAVGCHFDKECAVEGACQVATCNAEKGVCSTSLVVVGTVCRPAAGVCDAEEKCTGESAACPVDVFSGPPVRVGGGQALEIEQIACRPAAGTCDAAEFCSGKSVDCPEDAFAPAESECRQSAGVCDVAELCSGRTAACPEDAFAAVTVPCRESAGICDTAETCTGQAAACPGDVFVAATMTCRESAGICDVAETCTGTAAACPGDAFQAPSVMCRESAGDCDVAEACTGQAAACPGDGFKSGEVVCRGAAGDCDVAESCTGQTATCPGDGFKSTEVVCRGAEGICDVSESCTGQTATCPVDGFKAASVTCRESAGICDTAETCTGQAAACPGDVFVAATVTCRESAGICDVVETCTGAAAACPGDAFQAPSVMCRESAGDCDVAEACTGQAAVCPGDGFKSGEVVCRGAAGDCDVAESCTGQTATCPGDGFKSTEVVCRGAEGICDVSESCTGQTATCPVDGFKAASVPCRESAGVCDVEEKCTGGAAACPAEAYQPTSVVCRESAGDCDVAESCTGQAVACPKNDFKVASVVCRVAGGDCDTAENCSGQDAVCPKDDLKAATVVCRASGGVCDPEERCTGLAVSCPSDALRGTEVVCRESAGDCDIAENCNGQAVDCPANAFRAATVVCRQSGGDCDIEEACTGNNATCPTNAFHAATTVCRPSGGDCDVEETCSGSTPACPADAVEQATHVCRAAAGICDVEEKCNGEGKACPSDTLRAATVVCREPAAGGCDVDEKCTGASAACPADGFAATSVVCRAPAAGGCDVAETCPGNAAACPTDGFQAATVVCREAAAGGCDVAETCTGTAAACPTDIFAAATVVCRAASGSNMCDSPETCAGNSAACPVDGFKADNTSCSDGDMCTGMDVCRAGVCGGTNNHCGNGTCDCTETTANCRQDCPGPGDLDPTFGTSGITRLDVQSALRDDEGTSVAVVYGSQNILVGGTTRSAAAGDNFLLARFLPTGTLDPAFGAGTGLVQTDFGASGHDRSYAMSLDPTNAKIYLAGSSNGFAVARYDLLGGLDTTFNVTGLRIDTATGGGASWRGISAVSDGSVVTGGEGIVDGDGVYKLVVAKFKTDGAVDQMGFNPSDGYRVLASGLNDTFGGSLARQTDGAVVIGGTIATNLDDDMLVCRLTAAGALDTTWDADGYVLTDWTMGTSGATVKDDVRDSADSIEEVAIDGSNNVVVVGRHYPQVAATDFDSDFAIARYKPTGDLDTTFGTGGKVRVDFDGQADGAYGVAIDGNGAIVVVGQSKSSTGKIRFAAVRLLANGTLDSSFGTAGKVTFQVDASGFAERAEAVTLQGNGNIVIVGWTGNGTHRDLVVARLLATSPSAL